MHQLLAPHQFVSYSSIDSLVCHWTYARPLGLSLILVDVIFLDATYQNLKDRGFNYITPELDMWGAGRRIRFKIVRQDCKPFSVALMIKGLQGRQQGWYMCRRS